MGEWKLGLREEVNLGGIGGVRERGYSVLGGEIKKRGRTFLGKERRVALGREGGGGVLGGGKGVG